MKEPLQKRQTHMCVQSSLCRQVPVGPSGVERGRRGRWKGRTGLRNGLRASRHCQLLVTRGWASPSPLALFPRAGMWARPVQIHLLQPQGWWDKMCTPPTPPPPRSPPSKGRTQLYSGTFKQGLSNHLINFVFTKREASSQRSHGGESSDIGLKLKPLEDECTLWPQLLTAQ